MDFVIFSSETGHVQGTISLSTCVRRPQHFVICVELKKNTFSQTRINDVTCHATTSGLHAVAGCQSG